MTAVPPTPLSPTEERLYREALATAPGVDEEPRSLLDITSREWADRCRRLLATLDAARAATPATSDRLDVAWLARAFNAAIEVRQADLNDLRHDIPAAIVAAEYERLVR